MTTDQAATKDDARPAFLVERYLPATAAAGLAVSVARLATVCAASALGVEYVQAIHLRADDTCFCLFRAPSEEAVRVVNSVADFPFDRISVAVLVDGAHQPRRSAGSLAPICGRGRPDCVSDR